jgi:hypothetical protein
MVLSLSALVILSTRVNRGCDLRRPVVDSVAGGTLTACRRLPPLFSVVFEGGDNLVEVAGDLPVHLGDAGMA